jgi:hypothetical protein
MQTQAGSRAQLTNTSLTDVILALCASGHFGVREAIAAALRQGPPRMGPDPSDAATTGTLTLATSRTEEGTPPATPARQRLT